MFAKYVLNYTINLNKYFVVLIVKNCTKSQLSITIIVFLVMSAIQNLKMVNFIVINAKFVMKEKMKII